MRRACLLAAAAVLLAAAPAAHAGKALPEDNSALDQYVESLPGPSGDQAPAAGGGPVLPARVRRTIAGSRDAAVLARLAAAPPPPRSGPDGGEQRRGRGQAKRGKGGRPFGEDPAKSLPAALVDSVFSTTGGALAALLVLILAVAAIASVVMRRRDSGGRPS